jgi:hypothetical protein
MNVSSLCRCQWLLWNNLGGMIAVTWLLVVTQKSHVVQYSVQGNQHQSVQAMKRTHTSPCRRRAKKQHQPVQGTNSNPVTRCSAPLVVYLQPSSLHQCQCAISSALHIQVRSSAHLLPRGAPIPNRPPMPTLRGKPSAATCNIVW